MQALENIRPITDLRLRHAEVCAQATETQEPIVLTKNGSAAYVLFDSKAYEAREQKRRMQMALREAEIEERYNPQCLTAEESNQRMQRIFSTWDLEYA